MAKPGKKYQAAASKIEDRPYDLNEAVGLITNLAFGGPRRTILYVTAGKSIFTIPLGDSGYALESGPVP